MKLFRIFRIFYIFLKYDLLGIFFKNKFYLFFRNIFFFKFKKNFNLSTGKKIRFAFQELGSVFIKFGQLLSIRSDILSSDVIYELNNLQDNVLIFNGLESKKIIENSLNKSISNIFISFDLNPFAAASVAQVHNAVMLDGKKVVVKVLRPNIRKDVELDFDLILFISKILELFFYKFYKINLFNIVLDLKKILIDELNLLKEASNLSKMKKNFLNVNYIVIPNIFWAFCSEDVLVMEKLYGIPISKLNNSDFLKSDIKFIVKKFVELFFLQVFRDGYFHADMHPGNIWISYDTFKNPKIILLDFGIMGNINNFDRNYLGRNILAFTNRNYLEVAKLHIQSGWLPDYIDIIDLEKAICFVFDPIFNLPLKKISFRKTVFGLIGIAKYFDMKVQSKLFLFQKTLITVEGLSRFLYPNLDIWKIVKTLLEKLILYNVSYSLFINNIRSKFNSFFVNLFKFDHSIEKFIFLGKKVNFDFYFFNKICNFFKIFFGFFIGNIFFIFILLTIDFLFFS